MDDGFSPTGVAFAIVSPCSQCKNQLSEMSRDGKPFCPRRKWQADQAQFQKDNNGNVDSNLEPLVVYGTEGTAQEGDQSLRNPVYLDKSKSTLVWIATLRDNSGVRDSENNTIAPSILDPSFIPDYTEYIHCRALPYIPMQHEAAYRTFGNLKEGDQVFALSVNNQQNSAKTAINGDNPNEYRQVPIEGVVTKVNLVYDTPRSSVDTDYVVQGS